MCPLSELGRSFWGLAAHDRMTRAMLHGAAGAVGLGQDAFIQATLSNRRPLVSAMALLHSADWKVKARLTGEACTAVSSLSPPRSAFVGFHFPAEVIVVAVRWY